MLKIGATDWGQCPKCIHYDEGDGCRIIADIEIFRRDDTVYCIDGEMSECDDYADVDDLDLEEPWE